MKRIASGLLWLLILSAPAAPVPGQEAEPSGEIAATPPAQAPQGQGTLVVTAVGVREAQGGRLLFLLYRGEPGWLKPDRAVASLVAPTRGDSVQVQFAAVQFDSAYAVQVIHDKNGNGRFDMRTFPFPKPKEGGGVSNNHTRMGPPQFAKARFALADSLGELRVIMRY